MYDREPLYVISVAARLLDMHAQTLRKYEREQFIKPSRTQGRRSCGTGSVRPPRSRRWITVPRTIGRFGLLPKRRSW